MQEININDIENIKIGNAENQETGVTVIICEKGAPTGLDVRGGGPASRESELLKPVAACEKIHAVVLSGGSAFGLDCAGGVMEYLEGKNIGFETPFAKVPLVCQSCIFDLGIGNAKNRPNKEMAYKACENAENKNYKDGCFGAGTGATVGKFKGLEYMLKSGIGSYAVQVGDLKIGAIMCVNAMGDVYDTDNNEIIAGLLNENKNGFLKTTDEMYKNYNVKTDLINTNTTIGAVITNAKFDKTHMNKVAAMAQNGMARAIAPVHTTADGDSVYAMSVGEVDADINVVGTLAAEVVAKAIKNAVLSAESRFGIKCAKDIGKNL